MKNKVCINNTLLQRLIDDINIKNLPIGITVGENFKAENGDVMVEILLEAESSEIANEIICNTINDLYNLHE